MADESNPFPFNESSIFPWLKTAADMWLNMAKTMPPSSDTTLKTQTAVQNRFAEQLETNLNLLKSFSRMMSEPESASAAANSVSALPEILIKMARSGFDAAMQIQNHLMEKAGKIGKRTEAYNFDNLDQDVFKALTDVYEKELRQYLKIPPLGLTRFYQERFNELLDKHILFETTLAEFLSILYLPMEKSFKVLQEKLQEMAEQGKSKEYTDALHRTLNKLEDFLIAKNDAMRDFLQLLPVVTHKDMDEMYKEFHLLKMRVKKLEKKAGISPNAMTAVK